MLPFARLTLCWARFAVDLPKATDGALVHPVLAPMPK
jgi:hypothetical protein